MSEAPADYDFHDFIDLDFKHKLDNEAFKKLNDLKQRLCRLLPENTNVYNYEATWTGNDISKTHIDKLCNDVYESLSMIILNEID